MFSKKSLILSLIFVLFSHNSFPSRGDEIVGDWSCDDILKFVAFGCIFCCVCSCEFNKPTVGYEVTKIIEQNHKKPNPSSMGENKKNN